MRVLKTLPLVVPLCSVSAYAIPLRNAVQLSGGRTITAEASGTGISMDDTDDWEGAMARIEMATLVRNVATQEVASLLKKAKSIDEEIDLLDEYTNENIRSIEAWLTRTETEK